MEHDAADELHVEGALAQRTHGGLPAQGEGLGQDAVQTFAALNAHLIFAGFLPHALVGEGLHFPFQGIYLVNDGAQLLDLALVGGAEELFKYVEHGLVLSEIRFLFIIA